jgi:excisionase family DNA binding protein
VRRFNKVLGMKLLTVKEVAEKLNIAEATVYAWKAQGILPAVQLSRKAVRFREKDIEDLIERKLVHSGAQPFPSSIKPRKQKKSSSANIIGLDGQIQRYIESAKREVLSYA